MGKEYIKGYLWGLLISALIYTGFETWVVPNIPEFEILRYFIFPFLAILSMIINWLYEQNK